MIVHEIFVMKLHSKNTVVAITEICPAKNELTSTSHPKTRGFNLGIPSFLT